MLVIAYKLGTTLAYKLGPIFRAIVEQVQEKRIGLCYLSSRTIVALTPGLH